MIVVLLNNKLITCDTIVPFLYEIKKSQPDRLVELFCFNGPTYDAIMQNTILAEAIAEIGILRLFGTRSGKLSDKVKGKMYAVFNLARLSILVVSRNVQLIHFKALNYWPLKLIFFLNRRRAFLFQPSMAGSTALESQVDNIAKLRKVAAAPVGSVLIGFKKNWDIFARIKQPSVPKLVISAPCKRPIWMEYLNSRGRAHLERVGVKSNDRIITYILSSMCTNGWLKNPDDFPILFDETLKILGETCPESTVVIKPHPVTLPANIELQRSIMKRHTNLNIVYANINPMLLASQSKFFISNGYSSTFLMAKESGVPTIEYTDPCDEILLATNGGSMRPDMVDHFIRRDPSQLQVVLNKLLKSGGSPNKNSLDNRGQDEYDVALRMFDTKHRN